MKPSNIYKCILENMPEPVVFVDTEHIIRYMNAVAIQRYGKWGGEKLIGQSILDCHNERSRKMMLEFYTNLLKGGEEEFYPNKDKEGRKLSMRAVRNSEGKLIGYYERHSY